MTRVTLIKGDGIGPEISDAVLKIFDAQKIKIDWDEQVIGQKAIDLYGETLPENVIQSIKSNTYALKAPVTTPIAKGFSSVNVGLRKKLDLYANLRCCSNIEGIKTRFDNVDIVVVRENTEDLYAGIERQVNDDCAESVKIITKPASKRIAEFAFNYAQENNRKEVCVVTKANICKLSDGLFLNTAREVAENYPLIKLREILVDNCCMQLVQNPEQFDVLLLPNLYGDIVSDLTAGLIGGLGVAKGVNIGANCRIYEPVHGAAPDIAGKNLANPTALLLSALDMLSDLGLKDDYNSIKNALFKALNNGFMTKDLGGTLSCSDFTDKIIYYLK